MRSQFWWITSLIVVGLLTIAIAYYGYQWAQKSEAKGPSTHTKEVGASSSSEPGETDGSDDEPP